MMTRTNRRWAAALEKLWSAEILNKEARLFWMSGSSKCLLGLLGAAELHKRSRSQSLFLLAFFFLSSSFENFYLC